MVTTRVTTQVTTQVLIVGGGFGGIGMAIQLQQAGLQDVVVLEKAASVGGTWRDNRYPGAACDVQSHLYSYSFAKKPDWSRKYAQQAEIEAYIRQCVVAFGLTDKIHCQQEVAKACFDETTQLWHVETRSGACYQASFLVSSVGQLNQPAYPDIPGLDTFAGPVEHSARWPLHLDVKGQRVAVIGTGASAIQFVPKLVPQVHSLSLFQRSAAWVIPRDDRQFRTWEQRLFAKSRVLSQCYRSAIYLQNESRAIGFTRLDFLLKVIEWKSQRYVKRYIKDPEKRRQLTPDYPAGCKRVLISDDYYQALAEPHVGIVTDGIARVVEDGIITQDGQHHPIDVLVLGTGFKATEFLSPMHIEGLHGQSLHAAWQTGAEAYNGVTMHGFPNFFMLYGPNTNLAHSSILYMLESQYRYVLSGIRQVLDHPEAKALMPKASLQQQHNQALQTRLANTVWARGCNSWYKNADGKNTNNWPGFTFMYRRQTRQVVAEEYEWLT